MRPSAIAVRAKRVSLHRATAAFRDFEKRRHPRERCYLSNAGRSHGGVTSFATEYVGVQRLEHGAANLIWPWDEVVDLARGNRQRDTIRKGKASGAAVVAASQASGPTFEPV